MEWLKVVQVAEDLKVSKAAVYKRIESLRERLTPHLRQENGTTLISSDGFSLLQQSIRQKKGTLWESKPEPLKVDSTFNQHSTESLQLKETFNLVVEELKGEIRLKNQTVDRLLTQLEEDRRRQAEERQRSDSIIMKLAHDLEDTRRSTLAIEMKVNSLLPKIADPFTEIFNRPVAQVKAWSPPKVADPAARMGFLRRVWVEFTQPEQLRRTMES